jgi:haloacetate dehalogenase
MTGSPWSGTWTKRPDAIPPPVRAAYLAAARQPEVIHTICDDYRASAFIDAGQDENDQRTGRVLAMPVFGAWQDPVTPHCLSTPNQIWSSWAPDLRTQVLPCGHFLPEEQPSEIATAVADLVGS